MYVFTLMVESLSTYLTMHVYRWNRIFHLNYIIWCYWIKCFVLMIMSWVVTQDDWVVILSYEMWVIISANRVYVDNLGPTSIGETLLKFWWNLYIKKNLPENFQYITKKKVEKSGLLQLVSERGCDSIDFISMESIMNHVS